MTQFSSRRLALMSATFVVVPFSASLMQAAVVTNTFNLNLANSADTVSPDSKTTLVDFNADGTDDFSFTHTTDPVDASGPIGPKTDYNGKLTLDAASTSLFLTVAKDYDNLAPASDYAENLEVGTTVGPSDITYISLQAGGNPAWDNRLFDSSGISNIGAFGDNENSNPDGNAYIGFQFGDILNPNFGYLTLSGLGGLGSSLNYDLNGATLSSVSYETTPGVGITVVPEPGSLALLAGGAGIALLRRRRVRH
ncbi:MAG: PEP-CTERM sorting domain-containing protein [Verrucomicrobiaceae bacterium]|nr:MAG: PEP-CTERM sorting domain-containing protein [Verrucomicrobiaceae bacterium]